MKCGEIASRPPIVITPDETLDKAVELLATHDVGILVVVDRNNPNKPVGVLSERDVVRALAWRAPLTVTVREVATTTGLIYVYTDDPVELAAGKMVKHGIRHVLVLNKSGDLYGVISQRDIVALYATHKTPTPAHPSL
ncbi:CBS domain-containing protein [Pyrobaculum ferrireducens]|nr:CBS domain-containing protein [Pyrobaculum ferrireducens]